MLYFYLFFYFFASSGESKRAAELFEQKYFFYFFAPSGECKSAAELFKQKMDKDEFTAWNISLIVFILP